MRLIIEGTSEEIKKVLLELIRSEQYPKDDKFLQAIKHS